MKTFEQFLTEAKPFKPDALETISRNVERKHGMKFFATPHHGNDIRLHNIEVPKEKRGQGIGTRALRGLTKFADRTGKRIVLSPAPEKGKKEKLNKFYRSFGFVANKGRNKDFSVSDTMIRPQSARNTP
jgi:GNAT superfamily N-acetyltransferase